MLSENQLFLDAGMLFYLTSFLVPFNYIVPIGFASFGCFFIAYSKYRTDKNLAIKASEKLK